MKPTSERKFQRARRLLLLSGLLVGSLYLAAQEVSNFTFGPGGYFDPPYEKQLKSMLTGAKARPLTNGLWVVINGHFETYEPDGKRELLVEAPQCLYDQPAEQLRSNGPLHVQAADGKFSIEGDGFLWRQTNSALFISNHVHTIVHPDLLQANSSTGVTAHAVSDSKGIEIFSDQFDYTGESGLGNYRQNLRVQSSDLNMTGGRLQFLLPMKARTLQKLTVEQDVSLDSGDIHATGQTVIYVPENGLIRVQGQPRWQQAEFRQGHGDELVIDRTNKIFQANGHAYLRIAGADTGQSSFFPASASTNVSLTPATNQIVEVESDSYEIQTNFAVFRDGVLVKKSDGDQSEGTMTCGHLTVTFSGTNQFDVMKAEQSVVISEEMKRFTADMAVYTATNGLLEMSGNPAWQDGARQGKGDLIVMSSQSNQLSVRGNASLRLPAQELGAVVEPSPTLPERTTDNRPSLISPTNSFAEIFCREYRLQTNFALFEGGVRIVHPQMLLTCQTMTAGLGNAGERAETVVAEGSVAFDLSSENGQKIHGTGRKAVYTYQVTPARTNDLVELTGDPLLTLTNGSTFHNDPILLDRAQGKLRAPGRYIIHGVGEVASTNVVLTPKSGSRSKKRIPHFHESNP